MGCTFVALGTYLAEQLCRRPLRLPSFEISAVKAMGSFASDSVQLLYADNAGQAAAGWLDEE